MRFLSVPLAAALLAGGLSTGLACGYHAGLTSDTFNVAHPRSLAVAVAVNRATRTGTLAAPVAPALPTFVGADYRHAVDELRALQARLDGEKPADMPVDFSLVFVGPRLWTSFHVGPDGAGAEVHVATPTFDQRIVLTDEAVLAALLSGRLGFADAVDQGLLVVTNDADGRVLAVLGKAFADPGDGVVAN